MDSVVHKATEWEGKFAPRHPNFEYANIPVQGDNWNDLLKEVITFNSVEEFWGVYVCYFHY